MSPLKTSNQWRWIAALGVALVLVASGALGAIITPLYVGNLIPVLDQFGNPMVDGCRVELRTTRNGTIIAPTMDGVADASNPLATSDSVCVMGLNASRPGIFCMTFTYRLPPGTKIFARVFNAPTLEGSTFYVDSLVAVVPKNGTSVVLNFGEAQPLDSRDIDADGLVNSWETVLGTDDRFSSDYDGDGISDLDEMYAGTSPADAASLLAFNSICAQDDPLRSVAGESSQSIRVSFQSVPGKTYQVEYMSSSLVGQQEFTTVGTQTAEGDQCEMLVEVPAEDSFLIFRLRLITD